MRETSEKLSSDNILRLPDSIIHHIFTFLPSDDVARVSVLSKAWNHIWSTYPYVHFNFLYGDYVTKREEWPQLQHEQSYKQEFLDLIANAMQRCFQRNFDIKKFLMCINFPDMFLLGPHMDRWLAIAVDRNIPELILHMFADSFDSWYCVPQRVFTAESLKVLSFAGCKLKGELDIELPNLQKLCFSNVYFAAKIFLRKVARGCPLLEHLEISYCEQIHELDSVSSFPQLKYFSLVDSLSWKRIKVHACNLHTFSYSSSKGKRCPIDLTTYGGLRVLKLHGTKFINHHRPFEFEEGLISNISTLEVLELQKCSGLRRFKISSQLLKTLVFRNCGDLEFVEVDSPNLLLFEYCGLEIPFFPRNTNSLLKVHMRFCFKSRDVDWQARFQGFLANLVHHEHFKCVLYNYDKVYSLSFSFHFALFIGCVAVL